MQEQRDSGVLFRLVYQAMQKAGVDTDVIFRRLGVDENYLQRENLRTPHAAQVLFWQVVEDVTGDPDIGLHLGLHVPTYKGQVLEYLFLSSPTFGDGLRRAKNYQRLLTDAADLELHEHGGESCHLVLNAAAEEIRRIGHFSECFVQGVLTFFNSVTDGQFRPSAVHFEHERSQGQDRVAEILGCSVRFGQGETRLYFPANLLTHPSPHHEPGLLALHERFASEQVAELEKQDIVGDVERLVAQQLDSGEVTLDAVATRLNMKPRTLRTRLTEANTSFNQVVSQFRYRLACRLLAATNESIDEIVYLTGFSEPSTFYRAFKRWSGMTPIEYRRQSAERDEAMAT
ncbi:AraC family transcriptional regulator [Salicola sp. Rm-C-2C1-2]|uniref:AraC family transcriptional regulator n=1 Tax=Salicola sp. Rm-C-2C1-2 TaxID=3141321 RepID=UPI0032E3B382